MAVALVLILSGGAVGAWWLLSGDDGSTTTTGTTGDPTASPSTLDTLPDPDQAAADMTAALHQLGNGSLEDYCSLGFSFGPDYVYSDRSECVDDNSGLLEAGYDWVRQAHLSVEVPASAFHETEGDTLAIRVRDKFEVGGDLYEFMNSKDIYDVEVVKLDPDSGGWRTVGWMFQDKSTGKIDAVGIVPSDAKALTAKNET